MIVLCADEVVAVAANVDVTAVMLAVDDVGTAIDVNLDVSADGTVTADAVTLAVDVAVADTLVDVDVVSANDTADDDIVAVATIDSVKVAPVNVECVEVSTDCEDKPALALVV